MEFGMHAVHCFLFHNGGKWWIDGLMILPSSQRSEILERSYYLIIILFDEDLPCDLAKSSVRWVK